MDRDFQKKRRRERLFDKMHRGVVKVCMGVTVLACLGLGYKTYEFFRYVRPLQQAQGKLLQDDLLLEGRHIEDSAPSVELST